MSTLQLIDSVDTFNMIHLNYSIDLKYLLQTLGIFICSCSQIPLYVSHAFSIGIKSGISGDILFLI